MSAKEGLRSFSYDGWHKGFYCDDDIVNSLSDIKYCDFFDDPADDEFPYYTAYTLLCGSCHIFALSLRKLLNYNAYIIEPKDKSGFHVFCQIFKNGKWYYVDARGITTSFDEFINGVKIFVGDEFIIRPVSEDDINEWKAPDNYDDEAYEFAEAIIKKFKMYYTL